MGERDQPGSSHLEFLRRLRSYRMCSLVDGARYIERGGGIILIEGGVKPVLFHINARFDEVVTSLEIHGLLKSCPYGCVEACALRNAA